MERKDISLKNYEEYKLGFNVLIRTMLQSQKQEIYKDILKIVIEDVPHYAQERLIKELNSVNKDNKDEKYEKIYK